jgi:hypothetical protein
MIRLFFLFTYSECLWLASALTLHASEAVDDHGQRHALGNLICGVLSPFTLKGPPLVPPITLTLMSRGSMLGGVVRDARTSGSLVLFKRRLPALH